VEPFIDRDFDAYVSKMAADGVWGGEPEIAMAAYVLELPVRVYSLRGPAVSLVNEYGGDYSAASGGRAVSLFFHGAGHYDLLARG